MSYYLIFDNLRAHFGNLYYFFRDCLKKLGQFRSLRLNFFLRCNNLRLLRNLFWLDYGNLLLLRNLFWLDCGNLLRNKWRSIKLTLCSWSQRLEFGGVGFHCNGFSSLNNGLDARNHGRVLISHFVLYLIRYGLFNTIPCICEVWYYFLFCYRHCNRCCSNRNEFLHFSS